MAQIIPFKAIRATAEKVEKFSASAYDSDIREDITHKSSSAAGINYLHILSPQMFMEEKKAPEECHAIAVSRLNELLQEGVIFQEAEPSLYVYRQVKGNNVFTCLIGLASTQDYLNGDIKKHELTRTEKEGLMVSYFRRVRINGSPVLLTYHGDARLTQLVTDLVEGKPLYHFISEEQVEHILWKVSEPEALENIRNSFAEIPALYIADGHHRSAALSELHPEVEGFMACFIPAEQLSIHGFHRYVKDFNGLSLQEFITVLGKEFNVERNTAAEPAPQQSAIHFYAEGEWYTISIPEKFRQHSNPRYNLDVSILDNEIFGDILGIKDTRTSDKIRFINGEVRLEYLLEPVIRGDMKALFMLYPVNVEQVITISEYGETMPPKSTWIEPKLRSGLLIHKF